MKGHRIFALTMAVGTLAFCKSGPEATDRGDQSTVASAASGTGVEDFLKFPESVWAVSSNKQSSQVVLREHRNVVSGQASSVDSCIDPKTSVEKPEAATFGDVETVLDGEACPPPGAAAPAGAGLALADSGAPIGASGMTPEQLRSMRDGIIEARDRLTRPIRSGADASIEPAGAPDSRAGVRALVPADWRSTGKKGKGRHKKGSEIKSFWDRPANTRSSAINALSAEATPSSGAQLAASDGASGRGVNEQYYPLYLPFYPTDYVNNMNRRFYRYYAPSGADYITVDFDFMDMESFDRVILYDKFGTCATYSGYHYGFLSRTCEGDYVDIWVKTDSSGDGVTYDGFAINGFYYSYSSPPVAVATANKYFAMNGEEIGFNHFQSYDYDNDIEYYYWDFGDGVRTGALTPSSPLPTHKYAAPGMYLVTLRVVDSDSNDSFDQFWIQISQTPPQITSTLIATKVGIENPARLNVEKGKEPVSRLEIDWGDNSVTSVENFSGSTIPFQHRYTAPGTYLIVVKAKNSGGTDQNRLSVEISGTPIPPRISLLNGGEVQGQENKGYLVTPQYGFKDDGAIKNITVDFGSGIVDPNRKFNSVQSYDRNDIGFASKKLSYTYRTRNPDQKTFKKLAGTFSVSASVLDNSELRMTHDFVFETLNRAPVLLKSPKRLGCSGYDCEFTFGPVATREGDLSTLFKDTDGSISDYYWEFFSGSSMANLTLIEGCGRQPGLSAKCTFPGAGRYFAKFTVVDNLGRSKDKYLKFKLK